MLISILQQVLRLIFPSGFRKLYFLLPVEEFEKSSSAEIFFLHLYKFPPDLRFFRHAFRAKEKTAPAPPAPLPVGPILPELVQVKDH